MDSHFERYLEQVKTLSQYPRSIYSEPPIRRMIERLDAAYTELKAKHPPLQWSEEQEANEEIRYSHVTCNTPFGRFVITWKGWKENDWPTVDETPWGEWGGSFPTVADAVQQCTEEYAKRIGDGYKWECDCCGYPGHDLPKWRRILRAAAGKGGNRE